MTITIINKGTASAINSRTARARSSSTARPSRAGSGGVQASRYTSSRFTVRRQTFEDRDGDNIMTIRVITKTTPNKRQTPVYPWLVDCPQDAETASEHASAGE